MGVRRGVGTPGVGGCMSAAPALLGFVPANPGVPNGLEDGC